MAYDKVIDSSVLDANLTSVANAIRTKGGTTGNLAFPTGFVNAISAIETGGKVTMEVYDITIASDLGQPTGNNSIPTILTANAFVKANINKDTFAVLMYPATPIDGGSSIVHGVYHGNANIASSGNPRYGFCYLSSSATVTGTIVMTGKVNTTAYNVCFRAKSTGNLDMYIANNRTLKAGSYKLILMCAEV